MTYAGPVSDLNDRFGRWFVSGSSLLNQGVCLRMNVGPPFLRADNAGQRYLQRL